MQAISRIIVFDPLSGSGPRQGTDSISFNRPVHTAVAALTGDTVADRKPAPSQAEHKDAVRLSWKARHIPVGTLLGRDPALLTRCFGGQKSRQRPSDAVFCFQAIWNARRALSRISSSSS